jgi:hypothetical protein
MVRCFFVFDKQGSTGMAKRPLYLYRVPRGYGYCRGTAACVPPGFTLFLFIYFFSDTGLLQVGNKTKPKLIGIKTLMTAGFLTLPTMI